MSTQFMLSENDLNAINAALDALKMLRSEVKRARQAGIEPDVTLEQIDEQEKKLLAIKRAYFTNTSQSS